MNTTDIYEQFRSFPRQDLSSWDNALSNVLKALFHNLLEPLWDTELEDLVDKSTLAIHTVFDFPHPSDEHCELHVLVVNDVPVGIAFKFGDKTDWDSRILNVEAFRAFARDVATTVMEHKLKTITAEPIESLSDLRSGYIAFLGESETCFAATSPRDMYGFAKLPEQRRAFLVDSTGQAHPVQAIGPFVKQHLTSDEHLALDRYDVTATVDGQPRVVDAKLIVFELVPGQAKLEELVPEFAHEGCWAIPEVFPHYAEHHQVSLLQRNPGRWDVDDLTVVFAAPADYERFMAEHVVGQEYPGTFEQLAAKYNATIRLRLR